MKIRAAQWLLLAAPFLAACSTEKVNCGATMRQLMELEENSSDIYNPAQAGTFSDSSSAVIKAELQELKKTYEEHCTYKQQE